MPAVPDARGDIAKWTGSELERNCFPSSFLLERRDPDALALHQSSQMQGMKPVVGAQVPPALAGVGVADECHGLRCDIMGDQMTRSGCRPIRAAQTFAIGPTSTESSSQARRSCSSARFM